MNSKISNLTICLVGGSVAAISVMESIKEYKLYKFEKKMNKLKEKRIVLDSMQNIHDVVKDHNTDEQNKEFDEAMKVARNALFKEEIELHLKNVKEVLKN